MFGEHEGAYSDWHPPGHVMANQYQELLHVPLMTVRHNTPKRITRPVSLVDLAANLAPLADLSWTETEIWPDVYPASADWAAAIRSRFVGRERKAVHSC